MNTPWISQVALCESPLEGVLLEALSRIEAEVVGLGYTLRLQQVEGPYRLDFAFSANDRKLVVEIDGHDFHERTLEQATRDRQRDRYLVLNGWRVIRFTGTEVYRNTHACVSEVLVHLQQMKPQEGIAKLSEATARQLIKITKRSSRTSSLRHMFKLGYVLCKQDANYVHKEGNPNDRVHVDEIQSWLRQQVEDFKHDSKNFFVSMPTKDS